VATIEEAPEGPTKEHVTGSELVQASMTVVSAPSISLQGQEEMRPSSPIEMMPSIGMPEQSLTTGLVVVRSPAVEIASTQASPSSSNEEVDYSGNMSTGTMCVLLLIAVSSHT